MSEKKDLWKYDDEYLTTCSLKEIIVIINDLEEFIISQRFASLEEEMGLVVLTETISELYNNVSNIRNRVLNDAFLDPLPRNWKNQKENILAKLFSALGVIQQYREYYRVIWISSNDGLKKVEELKTRVDTLVHDYDAKKDELEIKINELDSTTKYSLKKQEGIQKELHNTVKGKIAQIDTIANKTLDELQSTEGKMVSHVLTLMGVFTSVIAIILSVIITTSSWLNNASSSSAIIAFTIPNLVTLVAVISVVLLIYLYQKSMYPPAVRDGDKPQKAPTIISVILLLVILLITIFMATLAYRTVRSDPHVRYVISESEYVVNEEQDSNTLEMHKYIEFVFEGKSYKFAYDESYFHDSNLYYCPAHKTLE